MTWIIEKEILRIFNKFYLWNRLLTLISRKCPIFDYPVDNSDLISEILSRKDNNSRWYKLRWKVTERDNSIIEYISSAIRILRNIPLIWKRLSMSTSILDVQLGY